MRQNFKPISSSIYSVRTQAGFKQAVKHYVGCDSIKSEVSGFPKKYPSIVIFSDAYSGYHYTVADCFTAKEWLDFTKVSLEILGPYPND
jgi:hypothetical protein